MKSSFGRRVLTMAVVTTFATGLANAKTTTAVGNSQPTNAKSIYQATSDKKVSEQSGDEITALKEVSVTATRRKQKLQEVPMSITDISGQQLQHMQIRQIDDIRFVTPNILIQPNTGISYGAKVFIRGIGNEESLFTADPGVAVYINGVYIARSNVAMLNLYDVERIEVLRGPQGTLYGRNATGGAIRYITKKPDGQSRLKVNTTFGNYDRADVRAKWSGTIGDSIYFDAAFLRRTRDGIMHDLSHHRMTNGQDITGARVTFATYWGSDSFATLTMDKLRGRSSPTLATSVAYGPDGHTVVPKFGSFYRARTDIPGFNNLDQSGIVLTNNTHFEDFTWRSILHYRKFHNNMALDLDGTDKMLFELMQDERHNQYGYEAQFTSQTYGPVSWVGGVFLFRERNSQPTRTDIFAHGPTNYLRMDTKAAAAYGQVTWSVVDDWRVIGGFRYSYEHKKFDVRSVAVDGTPLFSKSLEGSWTRPDWKLVLQHDFSDNVMAYVSYTTGFKSGSFNGRGTTPKTITQVDPETLDAYEIGIKSTLFDRRLRLNADYYQLDYAGMQQTGVNPEGIITLTNATGALIQGIEVQLTAKPTSRLTVGATLSTLDGQYQNFSAANAAFYQGRSLKNAPEMQASLRLHYVQPLKSGKLTMSAQARYTSSFFQNQDTTPLVMTRANTQVNARIGYKPDDADWSVALWGKNLTDQYVSTGGFYIAGLGVATAYPNMPRSYGVDLTYRFW